MEYSIVPVTSSDRERVLDHLRKSFFKDEPLVDYLKMMERCGGCCEELEEFSVAAIPDGISIMAVDPEERILGVCLNGVLTRAVHSLKPQSPEEVKCPRWRLIKKMLEMVYWETDVFKTHPEFDKVLDIKILSVDEACRGRGVAKALFKKTISIASQQDIPLVRVDCTSAFSAKGVASEGFELVYSLPYSEYLDSDNRPIFTPKPPHTAVQTFVKRIVNK